MRILYSNILPLGISDGQDTVIDCFNNQIKEADRIEIAVGYISAASLEELALQVELCDISSVCLTIGMYYAEGMPERAYHLALRINQKWQESNIGEIRIVKPFKYHGKIYCFYRNKSPYSAIVGSANLGVIKPESSNKRQYEIATFTDDEEESVEIAKHLEDLKSDGISVNISEATDISLIHENNMALNDIELVTKVPQSNVEFYKNCDAEVSFDLRLKVPKASERFMNDGKHFTKSNINVCYAAPRSKRKPRDWYETQLTVGAETYKMEGYPGKNQPFFVVTDDGYKFKAHTTSDNNKQFSAIGDELIMGRWLKGRLAAAGIVKPINNTADDVEREGMITQEMLAEYGCDRLFFKKTGKVDLDEYGKSLDVWLLAFIGKEEE
ncbi:NgoFVII family restriction endonuclease [Rothia dentocariosa]|uniref:restriction endonuclease PLD domain-containing protein n=1 Tax=Rothia dentocariosa TaxID=2047 RepID=UPI0014557256|nr:restriction endonuclease PLD domain-containing protein [Rothia dentocariosa]NLR24608.1 NgoFVII family restriction endonuclease [Rothia dentocariosa]